MSVVLTSGIDLKWRINPDNSDEIQALKNVCIPDKSFDHIESIDEASRFVVENEHNGTSASAGVETINDQGDVMSMGVASSNYDVGSDAILPREGGLSLSSGQMMGFLNTYDKGFKWTNNPTDDGKLENTDCILMNLDEDGNLWIKGDMNDGHLGEIRAFALSMANAKSKGELQDLGWAICDGTTPASQGISDATITSTPNLDHRFLRMSDDETSGTTGGQDTLTLTQGDYDDNGEVGVKRIEGISSGELDAKPPYYEVVYFIRVK